MGRVGQTMAETLGEVSIELQRVRDQRDEAQQRLDRLASQRCRTCVHFKPADACDRLVPRPPAVMLEKSADPWGRCHLIRLPDYGQMVTVPAFTQDAEEYHAALHVRGDFGCVLHEQASDR